MTDKPKPETRDHGDELEVMIDQLRARGAPRRWSRRLGLALTVFGYLVLCRHLYFILSGDLFTYWNLLEWRFALAEALAYPVPVVDFPWQLVLVGLGFAVVLWVPMYLARCTNNGVALLVGLAGAAICPARLIVVPILVGLLLQMGMAHRGYKGDRLHMVGILPGVATLLTVGWMARHVPLGGLTQTQQTLVYLAPGLIALVIGELLTLVRHTYQRSRAHPTPPAFVVLIVAALHISLFQTAVGMEFLRYNTARVGPVPLALGPADKPLSAMHPMLKRPVPVSAAPWSDLVDGRLDETPSVPERIEKLNRTVAWYQLQYTLDSGIPMQLKTFSQDYPDSPYAPIALVEAAQLTGRRPNVALLKGIGLVRLVPPRPTDTGGTFDERLELLRRVRDQHTASGAGYLAAALIAEGDLWRSAITEGDKPPAYRDEIRVQPSRVRSYLRSDFDPRTRRDLGYMSGRLLGDPNHQTLLSEQSVDLARRILLEMDFMLAVLNYPEGALKDYLALPRPLEDRRDALLKLKETYGETINDVEPKYPISYQIELALRSHPDPVEVRHELSEMVTHLRQALADHTPAQPQVVPGDDEATGTVVRLLKLWPGSLADDLLGLARADAHIVRQDGEVSAVELGRPARPRTERALERLAWYRLARNRQEALLTFNRTDIDSRVTQYRSAFLALLKPVTLLGTLPPKRARRLAFFLQPEDLDTYGPDQTPVPLDQLLKTDHPLAPLLERPRRLWQFYREPALAEAIVARPEDLDKLRQTTVKLYVLLLFRGRTALELGDTHLELYRITGQPDHARSARQFYQTHEQLNPDSRHYYRVRELLNDLPGRTDVN